MSLGSWRHKIATFKNDNDLAEAHLRDHTFMGLPATLLPDPEMAMAVLGYYGR